MAQEARAQFFLEAPHRIEAVAKDMALLGERMLSVGRELTKQFEEVAVMPANKLSAWLGESAQRSKGEFALVLHPLAVAAPGLGEAERVLDLLLAEVTPPRALLLSLHRPDLLAGFDRVIGLRSGRVMFDAAAGDLQGPAGVAQLQDLYRGDTTELEEPISTDPPQTPPGR
jgi:hypothetical protein